jgi:hypothetical protein
VTERAGGSDQADVEADRRSNRRRASSRWIVLVAPITNSGLACVGAGTNVLSFGRFQIAEGIAAVVA